MTLLNKDLFSKEFFWQNGHAVSQELRIADYEVSADVLDAMCKKGAGKHPSLAKRLIERCALSDAQVQGLIQDNDYDPDTLRKEHFEKADLTLVDESEQAVHWNFYVRARVAKVTSSCELLKKLIADESLWVRSNALANSDLPAPLANIAIQKEPTIVCQVNGLSKLFEKLTIATQRKIVECGDYYASHLVARYTLEAKLHEELACSGNGMIVHGAMQNKMHARECIKKFLNKSNIVFKRIASYYEGLLTYRQARYLSNSKDQVTLTNLAANYYNWFSPKELLGFRQYVNDTDYIQTIEEAAAKPRHATVPEFGKWYPLDPPEE